MDELQHFIRDADTKLSFFIDTVDSYRESVSEEDEYISDPICDTLIRKAFSVRDFLKFSIKKERTGREDIDELDSCLRDIEGKIPEKIRLELLSLFDEIDICMEEVRVRREKFTQTTTN